MAERIPIKHKETGITKDGFYVFSMTTFIFGFSLPCSGGGFMTFIVGFVVTVIVGLVTAGVGEILVNIFWTFMYNKYYRRKLMEPGHVFNSGDKENGISASALGIII